LPAIIVFLLITGNGGSFLDVLLVSFFKQSLCLTTISLDSSYTSSRRSLKPLYLGDASDEQLIDKLRMELSGLLKVEVVAPVKASTMGEVFFFKTEQRELNG